MSNIKKLKGVFNNRGDGYPLAIMVALALLLIMTGVMEYYRLMIIANGVKENLQDAVISTVTENYADVYHATREGYSAAYRPVENDFSESLNYGDIYGKFESLHGLAYSDGKYYRYTSSGELEFILYDLRIDINNAPIRGGDIPSDRFEIDSYITLEVPVKFAGNFLPNMKIRLKTTAGYTPKF